MSQGLDPDQFSLNAKPALLLGTGTSKLLLVFLFPPHLKELFLGLLLPSVISVFLRLTGAPCGMLSLDVALTELFFLFTLFFID